MTDRGPAGARGRSFAVQASIAGGSAVSALGTGAVYPVTVIYLHVVRGLPVTLVGLAFTASALAALVASAVGGYLVERFSARAAVVLALLLQATGAAAMVLVTSAPAALAAMAVQGAGNGIFYSALTPLIVQVTGEDRRIRVLSMRYAVNNAGIGLGALAGGLVINNYGPSGYLCVYLANAVSFVLFATAVARLPATGGTPATRRGVSPRDYLAALANGRFRRLLLLQLVIVSFGYAQIDSSLPLYAKQHLGMSATAIGGLIATNTAIVTILQLPAGRFVAARGTRLALRALGGIWLLAMLIGFVAAQLRGAAGMVTVFLAVSVFSIGECLYTPGFQPALVHTAGSAGLGRHTALASMTWTVALLGAPALGLTLVQLPWPPAYWLVLSAAGGVIVALAAGVADVRERAGNAQSRRPDSQEAQPTNTGAREEH